MAEPQIADPFAQVNDAATQPAVVDPFAPAYLPPKGAFAKGVSSAARGVAAAAAGTGALVSKAVGADSVSAAALDAAKHQNELASEDTMRVEDVNSVGSGFDFLKYALGYLGTQVGVSLLSGGVGRAAGGLAAGTRSAAGAAEVMAAKHAGTMAGLAGSSLMQEVGQIYPDAIEQGVADPIQRSLVGGAIAAAADILPEAYVAKKVGLLGKASRGAGALREAAKVAGAEGATELFQTYVERASAGQPVTGPEAISDYVNSTVLGAFGGGIAGGVAGAYNKARGMVDAPDTAAPTDVTGQPTPAQPDEPAVNYDRPTVMRRAEAEAAQASAQPAAPVADPNAPTAFQQHDATGPGNTPTTSGPLELADTTPVQSDVIPPDRVEQLSKTTEPRATLLDAEGKPLPVEPVVIGGLQVTPGTEPIILPREEPRIGFQRTAEDLIAERSRPSPLVTSERSSTPREVIKTFDPRVARDEAMGKVEKMADQLATSGLIKSPRVAASVSTQVKRAAEKALAGNDGEAAKVQIEQAVRKALADKVPAAAVDGLATTLSDTLGELRLQSKDAVVTPEFKQWFGKSKMVQDGQPLRLYHITRGEHEALSPGGVNPRASGPAIWLSTDATSQPAAHNVGGFGGEFKDGTNVRPLYAKVENPLYIDDASELPALREKFKAPNVFPQAVTPDVVKRLKAAGHDGVVYETPNGMEIMVFDSEQLKSAIGNDGSLDAKDPSILSSRDATVGQVDAMLESQGRAAIGQVEALVGTPDHLRVATYLSDRGAGAIRLGPLKDVIEMNLNAKDVLSVANHEAFHYLEHRVLSKGDREIVRRAFAQGGPMWDKLLAASKARDLANGTQLEAEVRGVPAEARAYAFQFWNTGELVAQGAVERIFQSLKRVVERIQNWVAGRGFTSYEDIFDAISRGYYAQRYGTPFKVDHLDVPDVLQLASQDSLRELAERAKAGEIPQVQVNARIAEILDDKEAAGDFKERFMDRTREETKGAIGSLKRAYLSNISSGENLARRSAGYKNVFNTLTAYAQRKNRLIADGVEKQLSKWVKGAAEEDKVAASKALLERTVNGYEAGSSDYDTLRSKLSPYQREMFDQANAMIGERLEDEFRADQAIYARVLGDGTPQYQEWYANRRAQVDNLKKNGYFPERRYGDHVTHAYIEGSNGKRITLYYAQHEREADARIEEKELARSLADQPGVKVEYGYRYRAEYDGSLSLQQFLDMASRHGVAITQAEKERLAKALVSADSIRRSRLFRRKNIAGFSEDGMRVLAEFGVSMANKIAYHELGGAINDAIAGRAVDVKFDRAGQVGVTTDPNVDLWKGDGAMGGYFRNLSDQTADFVLSPRSSNKFSRALRGLASVQFLGGSLAAGMVQLTSMAMNTTPWLTQYTGYTDALARSFSGYKVAMSNHKALTDLPTLLNESVSIPGVDEVSGLRHALQIAAQDGTTLDTEIYQIMGLSRGQEYSLSGGVQKAVKLWMTPFRITEQWNRAGTFIAAFKLAKDQNKADAEAYKFAQETVFATQFRYDEANRPALARGDVGSLLFVFKSYPIFMLETMSHLAKVSPTAAVSMVLTLALMSGMEGLPFAEDLEDLIDTIAQRLFHSPFNTKRALRNWLKNGSEAVVGADLSGVLLHGVANELTGMSFASRVGMGNLIPGTRIGTADADYKRTMGELLGPIGTIVQGGIAGADALSKGSFLEAAKQAAPLAAQNLIKGAEQWQKGYASDLGGRKLIDVTGWEAFWQAFGFSSSALNRAYEADRIDKQDVAFYKAAEGEFMKDMTQALQKGDAGRAQEVADTVASWNTAHPDMPILLSPDAVRRRVQAAGMPINERSMRAMPRALRGNSDHVLGLEER